MKMKKNHFGALSAGQETKRFRMWKSKKTWVFGATVLVTLGVAGATQASADEITTSENGAGVIVEQKNAYDNTDTDAANDREITYSQNGEGVSTTEDYYTENGAGVAVAENDAYDNTDEATDNNREFNYSENGVGTSVEAEDFYDNTDADTTNDREITYAQNGTGVSVTADDFYDNTVVTADDVVTTPAKAKEDTKVVATATPAKAEAKVVATAAPAKAEAKTEAKTVAAASEATLPKTGETTNTGMVALGAMILATTAVGVVAVKSRKEEF
ncbi:LPXTG cell wall anchor domain-containing protein [Enterococcus asini]|nr:LPXTG cell wall anchor domain-containing protein [Enterococcus asini]